jgi:hypothetical protein
MGASSGRRCRCSRGGAGTSSEGTGLWSPGRSPEDLDAEMFDALSHFEREQNGPVEEDEAVGMLEGERFSKLLRDPGAGRVRGDVELQDPSRMDLQTTRTRRSWKRAVKRVEKVAGATTTAVSIPRTFGTGSAAGRTSDSTFSAGRCRSRTPKGGR